MMIRDTILKEFVRNGYSVKDKKRTWHINNPSLLFLTPELARNFLNLKSFKVYRANVVGKELSLIKSNSQRIRKTVGREPFNLIDLRCVDGERAHLFIENIDEKAKIRYCPIGTHPTLGKEAASHLKKQNFKNVVKYKVETPNLEKMADVPGTLSSSDFQKNVILLLGSTLALFDINDFLFNLSRQMFKRDLLVIGNGVRHGKRLVNLSTYKDESFDKWFVHLMKEIGFKDGEVRYDARFGKLRVECFYEVLVDKTIKHQGKDIEFKRGDEIIVATIYKYFESEIKKFCKMYFSKVEFLRDEDEEYALILCQR